MRALPPPDRLVGIDLARLAAILGMMAAHTLLAAKAPDAVVAIVDGPPSTLFAVLGGVSVVLAARARLARGSLGAAMRATAARGAIVAALGLLVQPFAPAVFVVLVPFGAAIAAASLLLGAPAWLLASIALVLCAASGSAVVAARAALPLLDGPHSLLTFLTDPVASLGDVLLTGVYPAVTWTGYVTVGMLVGRALLAARERRRTLRTAVVLAGTGAALVAAAVVVSEAAVRSLAPEVAGGAVEPTRELVLANGYGAAQQPGLSWQLLAAPHTGTPADMTRTIGIALLVIAALIVLAERLPERALAAIAPLRAAGAAPLTVYVVHVIGISVVGVIAGGMAPALVHGWVAWLLQAAIGLGIGAVLARTGARGPLERLVGEVARRAGGRTGTEA